MEYPAFLTAARGLGSTHHAIAVLGGMPGLRAGEMAGPDVESLATVRGYVTPTFVGKRANPTLAASGRGGQDCGLAWCQAVRGT